MREFRERLKGTAPTHTREKHDQNQRPASEPDRHGLHSTHRRVASTHDEDINDEEDSDLLYNKSDRGTGTSAASHSEPARVSGRSSHMDRTMPVHNDDDGGDDDDDYDTGAKSESPHTAKEVSMPERKIYAHDDMRAGNNLKTQDVAAGSGKDYKVD
jgi:hypothetical protein